jgi:hypothetical protein
MLPIEREMIGLIMKGTTCRLDDVRVSVFLLAWSVCLIAVVRTAQYERETKNKAEAHGPARGFPAESREEDTDRVEKGGAAGGPPEKRRT